MRKERVRYYKDFTDDFEVAREQDLKLPEDYLYIRNRFLSEFIYALAIIFGYPFCKLFLHTRYKNRKAFKAIKDEGGFIYGNHTQPVGDVFLPALACFPRRIYTVVSPANLSLPVIGKILPFLGALPLPDTLKGMKSFTQALEQRISENKIVTIYPEAHVWEYCTQVRPFSDASFKYPVKLNKPVYAMTVTYQKRRFGKKPRTTVYIDGPFYADKTLSPRQQAADLHQRVYNRMLSRSRHSSYDYIKYEPMSD
ncbi:MAG: 1-acyl-sn-glycerol-3-phosphate acyltransferase [Ruminococcus sp.]|nr:1-acyl-sn-glycerol-3-phosphate acyltransferase [Ruminococcus sp.]